MWIKVASGSESGTLSLSHGNVVNSAQILAFPGVDQTTPQDVAADLADQTTAQNHTDFSATVVTAGATLVVIGTINSVSATGSPPTGFTETADRTLASARTWEMSYLQNVSAGATGTQSIGWSGASKSVGIMLVLRPATAVTATNAFFIMMS
jgi:hypothetical protein